MAKNTDLEVRRGGAVGKKTVRRKAAELQRLFDRAVQEARAENRRLGIPNWYSINNIIVSDRDPGQSDDQTKRQNKML